MPKLLRKIISRLIRIFKNRVIQPYLDSTELPYFDKVERAKDSLFNNIGQFNTTKNLSPEIGSSLAQYYAYSEWARVALDVTNQYSGGDYFEFGSEGLNTLCNFLAAFQLQGYDRSMPDVRAFAFDVYGDPSNDPSLGVVEQNYFNQYTKGKDYYAEMQTKLEDFGVMPGRVELVKGYFKDTLNESFKQRLRAENRRIGFAFLDCNIPSSYKTVFDFLLDFLREEKTFIYMDEYFQIPGVAKLFEEFCESVYSRYGLRARYIRTAGAYGALFVFISDKPYSGTR